MRSRREDGPVWPAHLADWPTNDVDAIQSFGMNRCDWAKAHGMSVLDVLRDLQARRRAWYDARRDGAA
jgi:hypothetical protein